MHDIKATRTLEVIRTNFVRYGIPDVVVTDNGSTFTSQGFEDFLSINSVYHTKIPPYQCFKWSSGVLCPKTEGKFGKELAVRNEATSPSSCGQLLLAYKNTHHTVTGKEPGELFLRRTQEPGYHS